MSRLGTELPKEYSDRFDELRQNRVERLATINMELPQTTSG